MKSLRVAFDEGGARLVFDETVEGTRNTAQKCLINVGTINGSDSMFADRGTQLLAQAVRSELISENTAQHAANFAALDTLTFVRVNDPQDALDDTSRVTELTLSV